jgi:hypothetical protein
MGEKLETKERARRLREQCYGTTYRGLLPVITAALAAERKAALTEACERARAWHADMDDPFDLPGLADLLAAIRGES